MISNNKYFDSIFLIGDAIENHPEWIDFNEDGSYAPAYDAPDFIKEAYDKMMRINY